jgi:hypothetical protein
MNSFTMLQAAIAALFMVMALRAVRSGSVLDYLLAATQVVGVLILFSSHVQVALYLLLITAVAYLISQITTGARPISRILPVAGAAVVVLAIYL